MNKTIIFSLLNIFGTCKLKQWGWRRMGLCSLCCLFWFTVLNTLRRSTGEEGRKTRSKVTVFNSKGISRQQPQQRQRWLLLAWVGGGWWVYLGGRSHSSIENLRTSCAWKQTDKRQTQSQCHPNRFRLRTQTARQGDVFHRTQPEKAQARLGVVAMTMEMCLNKIIPNRI